MWLLDKKDNKFWWKRQIRNNSYRFVTKKENDAYWKMEKELFEKIAAKVYNDAFENRLKPAGMAS